MNEFTGDRPGSRLLADESSSGGSPSTTQPPRVLTGRSSLFLSTAAGAARIGSLACKSCVGGPHLPSHPRIDLFPSFLTLDLSSALGVAKRLRPLWAMTWILQRRSYYLEA
ncbi:hypothetical protein LA080_009536 [Diaporthe eres]|nr:hypothetical protein LA080_009536 [Diaporthe eres]